MIIRRVFAHSVVSGLVVLMAVAPAWGSEAKNQKSPTFVITNFGAVADDEGKDTEAIQRTIDTCAKAGGGTVYVPGGDFVTGALFLKSHVTLHVVAGGALLGSQDFDDFPVIDGRWEGIERKHYASLINGDGLENIAIVGRGVIDGRAEPWWRERKKLPYARGRLIGLYRCKNVLIEGLTLKNSPAWTLNPIYCENLTITGLTLLNPDDSPNTDGINPDSCRNVRISNCHIDVGDDCIAIKSGKNEDGRRVGIPSENITVTNCTMLRGHGGVVIGSEMSGGVSNVVISNCVFDGTKNGIRMKTQRGRGGVVQDIRVSNIVMRNIRTAIKLNMFYHTLPEEPVSERTPAFRNVHLQNITVRNARDAAYLKGLPEMPIDGFSVSNATFEVKTGFNCETVENMGLHNVTIKTEEGPALICRNVEGLTLTGFSGVDPHAGVPVVQMENVRDAIVRGCLARSGTENWLNLAGERSRNLLLFGNQLAGAETAVARTDEVPPEAVRIEP